MRNVLLAILLPLGGVTGAALLPPAPPVISLKAARAQGAGSTVTVRGVVLNGSELGGLRFIQDAESGLALYSLPNRVASFDELRVGDSLVATGQLKSYNGLLEMDPIASVQKLGSGRHPRVIKVPAAGMSAAFAEVNEGRLVEITGLTKITTTTGELASPLQANTNYLLDGKAGVLMRVNGASTGTNGLVGAGVPNGEAFDLRGVMGQFSVSGQDGYQLLPRLGSDIVRGGGLPQVTAEPVPTHVTNQGFTLEFTTRYPGDTRVSYGPSASQLTENKVEQGFTTQHRVVLDGLEPATTYYVRVGSRNAAGTAMSEPVPIITGGKKSRRK